MLDSKEDDLEYRTFNSFGFSDADGGIIYYS